MLDHKPCLVVTLNRYIHSFAEMGAHLSVEEGCEVWVGQVCVGGLWRRSDLLHFGLTSEQVQLSFDLVTGLVEADTPLAQFGSLSGHDASTHSVGRSHTDVHTISGCTQGAGVEHCLGVIGHLPPFGEVGQTGPHCGHGLTSSLLFLF